jgi:hypothetical protein
MTSYCVNYGDTTVSNLGTGPEARDAALALVAELGPGHYVIAYGKGAGPKTTSELIGARLRAARRNLGLTLVQVAEHTNGTYKPTRLSSYERGVRPVTVVHLLDLAEVYGCEPADLLPEVTR